LAKRYFAALRKSQGQVTFMQNHGMVVSGQTSAEVINQTETALIAIESRLSLDMQAYRRSTEIYDALSRFDRDLGIVYYSQDAFLETIAANGPFRYDFCPDCLVYCGKKALMLEEMDERVISHYYGEFGRPAVIWYKGHFYICQENMRKAKEVESVLRFAALVAEAKGSAIRYLSPGEQDYLLNWDAEKYRKSMK
jgi:rhamnose utilization protein RhaD (predicted bifunctional aldolase and dehydrogenase)